jgi:hypothetical protein
MTDKPRVILDAKVWQEGSMTTEGDCTIAHKQLDSQAWLKLDELRLLYDGRPLRQ